MIITPISAGRLAFPGTSIRWVTRFLGSQEENISGCNAQEIVHIEETMRVKLPSAYKQWMAEVGRDLGVQGITSEFRRSYMTYPEVLELRFEILELLDEIGGDRRLLDRAIPFYCWEFDGIFLLDLTLIYEHPQFPSIDCSILSLDQSTGETTLCSPSFSEFIGWKILLLADSIG